MKKVVLILLLLAVAGAGYYYYHKLSTGPEYSLMQAAKAVQDHDPVAFERYVDVPSMTGSLVDQVADNGSALGLLNPGGLAINGALRFLKPQLAKAASQEVRRYIETGSVEAASAPARGSISVLGAVGKILGPDSQFKGVKYTREEGEQALVGLELTQPRYDTTLVVEVKMRDQGDYWQATEITNTGDIIRQVAKLEKQRLVGGK